MLQLILILFGLIFSNENTPTFEKKQNTIIYQTSSETGSNSGNSTQDTGGNTGHKPPTIIPNP